jgi:hypothetical protein
MKCRVDICQLGRWVIWDVLLSALVYLGDSPLALFLSEDVEVRCTVVLVLLSLYIVV